MRKTTRSLIDGNELVALVFSRGEEAHPFYHWMVSLSRVHVPEAVTEE